MSNNFRQRLKSGETLLGTMVTLPTAATAEILADIGFDWLFLDAEHGSLEYSDIPVSYTHLTLPTILRV